MGAHEPRLAFCGSFGPPDPCCRIIRVCAQARGEHPVNYLVRRQCMRWREWQAGGTYPGLRAFCDLIKAALRHLVERHGDFKFIMINFQLHKVSALV